MIDMADVLDALYLILFGLGMSFLVMMIYVAIWEQDDPVEKWGEEGALPEEDGAPWDLP